MIKHYINGVKKVILVSSGKGGVGKSTMAMAIAEMLQNKGHNVGIVDADIYGPSIPTMLGINEKPELEDKKFIPLQHRGFQLMSIGFLVDTEGPIAWRGPMATKAIYQLFSATKWSNLDYLVVDMPPGTGDIHLSVLENYNIDGVYMVTTPQTVSLKDVERAINLYKKFDIDIKGIIENMVSEFFPGNSGEILSKKYDIPLLAKVALTAKISHNMDNGLPIVNLIEQFI
jgi:ATP-binding protein involved in chromosome partitioning